ncbi:alcohol dehydrogenase catalytic domain-containing protein, partial [Caballeronia telluris]|uniref:alcohol dehydrogenase catalytic domain-containing protein n=1 Tax=Caballeronia telluris TaxID=326475 RepID=UPI000B310D53
MKAAVYYGNRQITIDDVPEPSPSKGEVKIKVSRNGICGTDIHEYYDGPVLIPKTEPHPLTGRTLPVVIGHEFSVCDPRTTPLGVRWRARDVCQQCGSA